VGADVFMLQMWSFASCFEFLRNEKIVILFKMKEHMKLQRNRKKLYQYHAAERDRIPHGRVFKFPKSSKRGRQRVMLLGLLFVSRCTGKNPLIINFGFLFSGFGPQTFMLTCGN
jgi:hypothetical protein